VGQAIVVLIIVGFLMIAGEVFVPGLVLGLCGGLCLLIAVGLSYAAYGVLTGTGIFAAVGICTLGGFFLWLNLFTRTPIGKKIVLSEGLSSGDAVERDSLVGSQGVALTALRPAGTALINGQRVDVVAEMGFIEADAPVCVVVHEGMRIVVQPLQ